jgi:hypothetical protein
MKPTVYIETTIPSLLTAWPSRDLIVAADQQTTRRWWETRRGQFQTFVSEFVLDEAGQGDKEAAAQRLRVLAECELLKATDEVRSLTLALLDAGLIPRKAAADAAHIAVAAVHGMDFLLTWNCRHIANAMIADRVRAVCRERGCKSPIICTPHELMLPLSHET